ncbi:MAG: hypothetical protein JWO50_291 [Candidatus Kaiserbacteria bacterium]|nr:hypothetical protein [Candidatus Kaiserbacteria bacterium]
MSRNKKGVAIVLFAFIAAIGFYALYSAWIHAPKTTLLRDSVYKTQNITLSDATVVHALVADTPELQSLGLGGRSGLPNGEGMLFVFGHDDTYGFWMKDMQFSIDIVWLSSDKRVIYMVQSIAPETYPATFGPSAPSRYVLELPAGYTVAHSIKIGDQFSF